MTREEYTKGLVDMFRRGWTYANDDLITRFEMGKAETLLLACVPLEDRPDYFSFARERIWLNVGGKRVTLQDYLGTF